LEPTAIVTGVVLMTSRHITRLRRRHIIPRVEHGSRRFVSSFFAAHHKPTWVSQQVPDGTEWLEFMLVGSPGGRGVPPGVSKADAGVLDHFSLGVGNIEAAYTLLWNGGRLERPIPGSEPYLVT
jgi:hypothetical protein